MEPTCSPWYLGQQQSRLLLKKSWPSQELYACSWWGCIPVSEGPNLSTIKVLHCYGLPFSECQKWQMMLCLLLHQALPFTMKWERIWEKQDHWNLFHCLQISKNLAAGRNAKFLHECQAVVLALTLGNTMRPRLLTSLGRSSLCSRNNRESMFRPCTELKSRRETITWAACCRSQLGKRRSCWASSWQQFKARDGRLGAWLRSYDFCVEDHGGRGVYVFCLSFACKSQVLLHL